MARGTSRWRSLAVLVAFGAALVGCSNDGGGTVDATETDSSASGPGTRVSDELTPADAFLPPGSPIAEGLLVPEGAHLAGGVFREPFWNGSGSAQIPFPAEAETWTAYLLVDDDPFAVFDDLAAQLRAGPAPAMPGAADGCLWIAPWPESAATAGDSAVATGPSDDADQVEVPDERAEVRRRLLSSAEPPEGITGVECTAGAPGSPEAGSGDGATARRTYHLAFSANDRARPILNVSSSWCGAPMRCDLVTAYGHAHLSQAQGPGATDEPPGPEAAAPGAWEHLPPPPPADEPAPGDRFGLEANCFAGEGYGYAQFRLPDGAVVVADRIGDARSTILATDDAEATLADLRDQMEQDATDVLSSPSFDEQTLSMGERVVRYSHTVLAGGGACDVTVAAGGQFLRIDRHSD